MEKGDEAPGSLRPRSPGYCLTGNGRKAPNCSAQKSLRNPALGRGGRQGGAGGGEESNQLGL